MKKLPIILMSIALIFTLAACGSGQKTTKQTKQISLDNTVNEASLNYTISYPADWSYKVAENNALVIQNAPPNPANVSIINIQTYPTKSNGGTFSSAAEVIDSFKTTSADIGSNNEYFAEKDYVYTTEDGAQLVGRQIVVSMKDLGIHQKQVVIPSADGKFLYHWSYSTTLANYNNHIDAAEAMLASFKLK